jgi:Ras-related protein Rab-2A
VGVVAVFLTYSINNRESFQNLDIWLQEARDKANEGAIIILVGNKNDLEREVSYEEGMEYMKKNNLDVFFETSAKSGENVSKVKEE